MEVSWGWAPAEMKHPQPNRESYQADSAEWVLRGVGSVCEGVNVRPETDVDSDAAAIHALLLYLFACSFSSCHVLGCVTTDANITLVQTIDDVSTKNMF
eukprot:756593-Hanusia_phi.AAC.1